VQQLTQKQLEELGSFPLKTWVTGDCFDAMRLISNASVGLILCDLPYGTTLVDWDTIIPMDKLWKEYKRVLKPTGAVILTGNQPFTSLVIASNLPWFKQCLVWNKNKCGSPALAKIRPMQVHEDVMVFAPKKATYNPQMEEGEPYSRKSKNVEGYVGKANTHKYGMKPRTEFSNDGTRYPKSILNISFDVSAQQRIHPTQKPIALAEWLIRTYSNEGDVVLDHCAGSGWTAIACENTGRDWMCVERDVDNSNAGYARLEAHIGKHKGEGQ